MFKSGPPRQAVRDADQMAMQLLGDNCNNHTKRALESKITEITTKKRRREHLHSWGFLGICLGLVVTSTLSVLLLIASARGWTLSDYIYAIYTNNQATFQLVVQVFSNVLGLIYSSVLCTLINYASRVYWRRKVVIPMAMLLFWQNLCLRSLTFDIPLMYSVALVGFSGLTSAQSALWAGALTPVTTTMAREARFTVPSYQNSSLIKEYASQTNTFVPQLRNTQGFFTYAVGESSTNLSHYEHGRGPRFEELLSGQVRV